MAIMDSNGAEIRTGDVLEISGRSVKNDNGRFLVVSAPGDPTTCAVSQVTLHKCGKTGKLSTAKYTTSFWPYRREAGTATIIRADNPAAAEYFQGKAKEYDDQADFHRRRYHEAEVEKLTECAAFCRSVAARVCSADVAAKYTAEQEEKKDLSVGIRFYWNGIRVDGGNLIQCGYSLDDGAGTVKIWARGYKDLPDKYFCVVNNSDSLTDYFEEDRTTLTAVHPLYKYARYAAIKSLLRHAKSKVEYYGKSLNGMSEKHICYQTYVDGLARAKATLAKYAGEKNPGQPTAADYEAVEQMRTAAETARLAAEHEAQLAAREQALKERNEGRNYVLSVMEKHPMEDGKPWVMIHWSEHLAFYSWNDNTCKMSLSAAEIILKKLDEDRHTAECGGYDKTKFTVYWTEDGTEHTYEGRYDLGDNDGGLIQHIRRHGEYLMKPETPDHFRDEKAGKEIVGLADYLERFTDCGKVLSVDFAPGLEDMLFRANITLHGTDEERENLKEFSATLDYCQLLTDSQLEAAVMSVDRKDPDGLTVARFFLQQLAKRDKDKALEVFRRWFGK